MSRAEEAARRAELAANAAWLSKQAQVLIDRFVAEAVSAESRLIRCRPLSIRGRTSRPTRSAGLRKNESGDRGGRFVLHPYRARWIP